MMRNPPAKVVLLVDDQPEFHEIVALHLEEFPSLQFLCVHSGEEAYEVMTQQKVDIVISDLDMPNGNGVWLLGKISGEYQNVPVIIASSNVVVTEQELINLGASAFIQKMNLSTLPQKFNEFLNR